MNVEHDALIKATEKMDKTIASLKRELASIRAGRANPQLLDRIMVDYYGTPTPIHQISNISSPEPRLLVISPYASNILHEIEKAIQKSDLGINPSNDGKIIRLAFPDMTEERRKEIVKTARKMAEESKVAIRTIRRDANEAFKKDKKSSLITEDDFNDLETEVQTLTDKTIKKVDEILAEKEKEILEV
ncbi:MAG: ribosome recycling factor [Eubacteriales bacterium]